MLPMRSDSTIECSTTTLVPLRPPLVSDAGVGRGEEFVEPARELHIRPEGVRGSKFTIPHKGAAPGFPQEERSNSSLFDDRFGWRLKPWAPSERERLLQTPSHPDELASRRIYEQPNGEDPDPAA
jgi:hypothetical protein